MDTYYQQAFEILTSGRLAEALDVEKENPKVRDRYGDRNNPLLPQQHTDKDQGREKKQS